MSWRESIRHVPPATVLSAVVLAAFAVRAWSPAAGVPHAVGIDEPAVVDRALRILNTGDWNPHAFDCPTLVIYVHALQAIVVFIGGALEGAWTSLSTLDIAAIYVAARILTAAIGAATVFLTYRVGDAIGGRTLGLLAAAQLAVLPMHVRESHFASTDVPATALTTLGVWLSLRAASVRTARSYGAAGSACGLAAAAKYSGFVACAAPVVAWLVHESGAPGRGRKLAALVVAAAGAFVLAVPYALLDMPAFLDGFAAQARRLSMAHAADDPSWLVYLKHLALMGRAWLPLAALGLVAILWRRSTRVRALPMLGFGAAYFYTLATHHIVFARYVLPLLPVVCVLAAAPVVEVVRALEHRHRHQAARWLVGASALALTAIFAIDSIGLVRQLSRPDTRQLAAEWMAANLPPGARVVVENGGPTYLRGFDVLTVELIVGRPVEGYRDARAEYLVVSSRDFELNREYLKAGPVVFQIAPSQTRWGPPVRIVRLEGE